MTLDIDAINKIDALIARRDEQISKLHDITIRQAETIAMLADKLSAYQDEQEEERPKRRTL